MAQDWQERNVTSGPGVVPDKTHTDRAINQPSPGGATGGGGLREANEGRSPAESRREAEWGGAGAADEQRVRDRAYQLWEEEGRPEGRDREHWYRAEAEVRGGRSSIGNA